MSLPETASQVDLDGVHSLTLVLSSARSGSTLLCRDLAGLGGLGMPREYLRTLRQEPRPEGATEEDVLRLIAQGVAEDAPGVTGVKLMLRQAPATYEAISGERAPSADALPAVLEWAKRRFERLFVVFLVRNAMDQAISRVVADATGVYHSFDHSEGRRTAEIPRLNEKILANLDRVVRDRRILLDVQRQYDDLGLLLTYEELAGDPDTTASRLARHARTAGFEVRRDTVTREMRKVISRDRATEIREGFLDYLRTETGGVADPVGGATTVSVLDAVR